jgi:hypothetical protein
MSLEHKANQHPESPVSGLDHAVRFCSNQNKKVLQKSGSAFDSASLGEAFAAHLPLPAELEPHVEEALRHVLENQGSLVRPRIVFQMSTAFDLSNAHSKDLAIALEYFHTASLIFDDLPCMDDGPNLNIPGARGLPRRSRGAPRSRFKSSAHLHCAVTSATAGSPHRIRPADRHRKLIVHS